MKKFIIIVVAIGLAVTAFAMSDLYVSGDWHYKMIVTVDTPEGVKTGEVVRGIKTSSSSLQLGGLPESSSQIDVRGEAVVIDLDERGQLFGLISWDSYRELYYSFPFKSDRKKGTNTIPGIKFYNSLPIGSKAELPRKYYPQFVTFKDIEDPTSVEAVDIDNLSETFGESVELQNITIELVDEPVSSEILAILPWLTTINANIDGTNITMSNDLSNVLHKGNFIR